VNKEENMALDTVEHKAMESSWRDVLKRKRDKEEGAGLWRPSFRAVSGTTYAIHFLGLQLQSTINRIWS
jgi:hypothetical protein